MDIYFYLLERNPDCVHQKALWGKEMSLNIYKMPVKFKKVGEENGQGLIKRGRNPFLFCIF